MGVETGERHGFDQRVAARLASLAPAEARMALFFQTRKEAVVLNSAAQIAQAAGTSDATVVRTARSLGYAGLLEMREDILAELTGANSPARLMSRTLDAAGSEPDAILSHVLALHEQALQALRLPETGAAYARALGLIADADLRHVFGIGPSGMVASYAALQFNRIGLRSQALIESGVELANHLSWIGPGDAVLMFAYAPLYREIEVVLDCAADVGAPVILVSDSLGPQLGDRVAEVIAVPRGRSDHLSMHGATMVLVEALILGLAAGDRTAAIDNLDRLSRLRGRIDRDWIKRGTRRGTASDQSSTTPKTSHEGKDG